MNKFNGNVTFNEYGIPMMSIAKEESNEILNALSVINELSLDDKNKKCITKLHERIANNHAKYDLKPNDIKRLYNNKSKPVLSEAFMIYYTYFLEMKFKKIAVMKNTENENIVFLFDDEFIYVVRIKDEYHGKYISSIIVYDENRKPLMNFYVSSCLDLKNKKITQPVLDMLEKVVKTNRKNVKVTKLLKIVVNRKSTTNKILNVLSFGPEKHIYIDNHSKVLQCSSKDVIVAMKLENS